MREAVHTYCTYIDCFKLIESHYHEPSWNREKVHNNRGARYPWGKFSDAPAHDAASSSREEEV